MKYSTRSYTMSNQQLNLIYQESSTTISGMGVGLIAEAGETWIRSRYSLISRLIPGKFIKELHPLRM